VGKAAGEHVGCGVTITMAIPFTIEEVCGPLFRVVPAKDFLGPEEHGFLVFHRETGKFVYTGGIMSVRNAAQKLIDDIYHQ